MFLRPKLRCVFIDQGAISIMKVKGCFAMLPDLSRRLERTGFGTSQHNIYFEVHQGLENRTGLGTSQQNICLDVY